MGMAFGCHAVIGSLDECAADGDCAPRGLGLLCQNRLCVDVGRCTVLGSSAPDALTIGLVLPLTVDGTTPGDNAPHWRNAVALAIDQLNPPVRQGVGGRALRVLTCDSTQSPAVAKDRPTRFNDAVSALAKGGAIDVFGASGPLDFDGATGQAPSRVDVYRITNGTFASVVTLDP